MMDKKTSNAFYNSLDHSRGFGFIIVDSIQTMESILSSQPHFIKGKKVECKIAIPKENSNELSTTNSEEDDKSGKDLNEENIENFEQSIFLRKIFVGGLHPLTTENDMLNYFKQFGEIEQCLIMKDKMKNKSRGMF